MQKVPEENEEPVIWIEECEPLIPGHLNLVLAKAAPSKWLEFILNEKENIFKEGAD